MEETYLCPDCLAEHAEPVDPVLGHIARCDGCAMLFDALREEQALHERVFEIRLAA